MSAYIRYGTDSSGRPIFMTPRMAAWWRRTVLILGWEPVIVQGAFMSEVPGGGAADSAGIHDLGGCLDLRTRDLTYAQREQLVRVLRQRGAAAWRRGPDQGMTPHLHLLCGWDLPLTASAGRQWQAYLRGLDGLADQRRDYEERPSPLVTEPPEDSDMGYLDWTQEDRDALVADVQRAIRTTPIGKIGTLGGILQSLFRRG
jgi:hypothetical protein